VTVLSALLAGCTPGAERSGPAGHGPRAQASHEGAAPAERGRRQGGDGRRATRSRLGRSTQGRAIDLIRVGGAARGPKVLVVGCIHGTECAGTAITRRLERGPAPESRLWLVENLNPDGLALGTRVNARGVDLNRNFPSEWRPIGRRGDPQHSGPRPLSERETRLARALVLSLRPDITLWFHQPQAFVRGFGHSASAARRYARLARVPFRRIRWPRGTAPNWQNHRFPGASSFVVELPRGPLSSTDADRHARAVRRL